MQVSLNDLVSILASRAGQPFNIPLQEEMKVVLRYKRADFFKKLITQHPEQRKLFTKSILVELEAVDAGECDLETDCIVMKSVNVIPRPLRTDGNPFDFVGSVDKKEPIGYATPAEYDLFNKYNRYTSAKLKYFFKNNYLYIMGNEDQEYAVIMDMWPDPADLHDFTCDGVPCYTDNDNFDIPEDLINSIINDTLRNELRLGTTKQEEITVEDKQLNPNTTI